MKKYYCKDGQEVLVKPHPSDSKKIIVIYKKKKYCRSKNIINKTIFSQDPTRVGYNNTVILTDPDTNKILFKVKICETERESSYKRCGGSYYGAGVEIKQTFKNVGETNESQVINITKFSPIGSAVWQKKKHSIIEYKTPDNTTVKCIIFDFY
ncbi:MAG: hypothetical protein IJN78_05315 [Clostridia bacterium]|nr:hypothetical protein [Clostridia bacterium]MBQ7044009.1 hypothetical protein [Clostridia bacterium]